LWFVVAVLVSMKLAFTIHALLAGRGSSVDVNTLPGALETPACEAGLLLPAACMPKVVTGRAR
jgi:hypothetical protein